MKLARQNFADHMNEKLTIAKRQNEQVYHDTIPQTETLELVSGMELIIAERLNATVVQLLMNNVAKVLQTQDAFFTKKVHVL